VPRTTTPDSRDRRTGIASDVKAPAPIRALAVLLLELAGTETEAGSDPQPEQQPRRAGGQG